MVVRGEGLGGRGEKAKGSRSADWQLQNGHGDVKYSLGNMVSNTVVTVCGAGWVLEISRGPLCKVYGCLTAMLHT